jgi:hypothetical protein
MRTWRGFNFKNVAIGDDSRAESGHLLRFHDKTDWETAWIKPMSLYDRNQTLFSLYIKESVLAYLRVYVREEDSLFSHVAANSLFKQTFESL